MIFAICDNLMINDCYRIDRMAMGTESAATAQAQTGEFAVECTADVSDATHYVTENLVGVIRPPTPYSLDQTTITADGEDAVTLSGLEVGTTITVDGPVPDQFTVDDGSVVWRCLIPGEYRLHIEAPFPHLPAEVVIHGT